MPEAKRDLNEIISAKDVVFAKDLKIPDFSLGSGEILWMEMENPNWAKLLQPFFNGLLIPHSGSFNITGKDLRKIKSCKELVSCTYLSSYQAGMVYLNSLVHWIAGDKNSAQIWATVTRILSGIGYEYTLQVPLETMAVSTIKKISTAITLSIPKLVIILNEPFYGLEEQGKQYIDKEIENLSNDGSCVLILSQDSPFCRFDKNIFLGAVI